MFKGNQIARQSAQIIDNQGHTSSSIASNYSTLTSQNMQQTLRLPEDLPS
jgi:hypothetical protein